MAFGHKTGGRKKGTPNRNTLTVQAILDELGVDPIRGLALIAKNPKNPLDIRLRAYANLAEYVYPKRKAVEHSGPDGGVIRVEILDDDERL